ncbi:MAG: histidine utilization repressor [Oceanospirillaceae bacterium]
MTETAESMINSLSQSFDDSPAPIYAKVKKAISQKINSGEWEVDQRIPSESEIVKALNISRMTVNRALRELTSEGILVRQQGVGTFVAQKKSKSALFEVHNIADEIRARGHQHRAQLLDLSPAKANMEEAMNLGVRTNHSIYRSVILHFENELPIQLEYRVVNASLVPDYDKQDFQTTTAYDYLMKVAPLTEGEHLVESVTADATECELLQIEKNAPCLQIKRRTWSKGQLITIARLISPGARFQLFGHFGR